MLGRHLIKSWSSTQANVALSSGEAEYYAVVKACGIGMGFRSLLQDLGVGLPLRVWTDSSATIGICSRQGLGKLRHIDTQTLWVQQRVRNKTFELRKVRGTENPADLFTKHLQGAAYVEGLLKLFGCVLRGGRPAAAPQLRQGKGTQAGELLTAELEGRKGPVVRRNGGTFETYWHQAVEDFVPEAWSYQGQLPHLAGDRLNELFPLAVACEELGDEDPETDDRLESYGRQAAAQLAAAAVKRRERAPALLPDSQSGVRGEGGGS